LTQVVSAPFVLAGSPALLPPGGDQRAETQALRDGAVALDGDRILAVGPRAEVEEQHGRAERLDAVILPALVNAHLHLELSHLAGLIPGGAGLAPWIEKLVAERARFPPDQVDRAMGAAVERLKQAGVAAVGEVSNTLASFAVLSWAGFSGTIYHEVFGFSKERVEVALAAAEAARQLAPTGPPGLAVALSPHAVYSTHPGTVQRLLRAGPASIHLAEDLAERTFCSRATGPFADVARKLGGEELQPMGRSAVAAVAPYLGPRSVVVHAVDLDEEDLRDLRRSGATVVLCPRSNLHIGGRLADLPGLLDAGVPLAVGTDSLASSPSLSPLGELAALRRAYPRISAGRLLPLAWNGAAVGARRVGRLAAGTAPGVLAAPLGGARPEDPVAWLVEAFGEEERPFTWVARHRPEVRG
jgi:cytosine/adenosine deaminase-related metal-dependent hydrolase